MVDNETIQDILANLCESAELAESIGDEYWLQIQYDIQDIADEVSDYLVNAYTS